MTEERRRPTRPLQPVPFFQTLVRAVGADCRPETSIVGASGLEHPCFALGHDPTNNRLIAVSADLDARTAALAYADVTSAFAPGGVLFAQPALYDPNVQFQTIRHGPGWSETKAKGWQEAWQRLETVFENAGMLYVVGAGTRSISDSNPDEEESARQYGLCPIPLRGFSPEEIELFRQGNDLERVREVLRREGVLQYFFPPAGHLALGLVDRAPLDARRLQEQLTLAPQLGHPLGKDDIVDNVPVTRLIDELRARDLMVQGELQLELTQEGRALRSTVKFRPREGVISRLINRIKVRLNINVP